MPLYGGNKQTVSVFPTKGKNKLNMAGVNIPESALSAH